MIKKQNLWFLTLFSLILVLGVYYITMPDEIFVTNNNQEENLTDVSIEVNENEYLTALRVELEDERQEKKVSLEKVLNSSETSSEEKNNAYLQLKQLNELKGQEESIEKEIKTNYNLDAFAKVDNDEISIIVIKEEHDVKLANEIMRLIQDNYEEKKVISVKFEI